ncbi:hypothetical protein EMCRGX_G034492 [Ephydatia muelleri]
MAGAKLEYDDNGSTFFYFLVSFYGIVLLPVTYFLIPRRKDVGDKKKQVCQCEPCRRKKVLVEEQNPHGALKQLLRIVFLVVLWGILFLLVYKVLTLETTYEEYDPFAILQVDSGASPNEIRKQYRHLSKLYHPDKDGGNQEKFMQIAKAYEALTDEVSRENWEKYGNPDGPRAMEFGIALPSWIVERKNSMWVIVLYMLVFMVGLPILVGGWWYRSIKYGSTNVLLDTSRLLFFFMSKSSNIATKKLLFILTGSLEFCKPHAQTIGLKERPSDDQELNELVHSGKLPQLNLKMKEPPFATPYACKVQVLLNAQLERVLLPANTLLKDQNAVLKFIPHLLNEMLNILNQVSTVHQYEPRRVQEPSLDTYENVMKCSQMLVQALWDRQSPLLQLPHILPDQLRHFKTRKRNITTVEQFAALADSDRKQIVRSLSDEEYSDIIAVFAGFPYVEVEAESHVKDDENDHKITAGSWVTLSVTLRRKGLLDHVGTGVPETTRANSTDGSKSELGADEPGEEEAKSQEEEESAQDEGTKNSKAPKGSGRVDKKKNKKGKKPQQNKKKGAKKARKGKGEKGIEAAKDEVSKSKESQGRNKGKGEEDNDDEDGRSDDDEKDGRERSSSCSKDSGGEEESGGQMMDPVRLEEDEDVDEDDWRPTTKQKKLDQQDKKSHPVHAPFFPEDKQELWWLYVADKKKRKMISPPQRVSGLKDDYSTELHFQAPEKPCVIRYTVVLMSDSYMDLSYQKELKLDVEEACEVSGKEQWKELEEEEEQEEAIEESGEEDDANSESEADADSHGDD